MGWDKHRTQRSLRDPAGKLALKHIFDFPAQRKDVQDSQPQGKVLQHHPAQRACILGKQQQPGGPSFHTLQHGPWSLAVLGPAGPMPSVPPSAL